MSLSSTGLRARLLLLVFFAVIPAFALNVYTAINQRQRAAENAETDALNLVRLAAREQSRLLTATRQLLLSLSKLPEVKGPRFATPCNRVLAELNRSYPFYTNIGAVTLDGDMFCNSRTMPGRVNISDRAYFRRTMQSRDFGVGDYQIGRVSGRNSINLGFPVMSPSGDMQSVIFAGIDLDWINQMIAGFKLPADSAVLVVDSQGTILARYPDSEKWVGKPMRNTTLMDKILSSRKEGSAELEGSDGVIRLYAYAPLHDSPHGNVYVSVGLSRDVVFAAANEDYKRNIILLLIVAVMATIFASVGSDAFVLRRIKALSTAAQRLGEGDLTARTGLPYGKEEIGQLAHTFDNMAYGLQIMTTALQRVNRALKTLSACNRAMLGATEELALLAEMCRTTVQVGGYRSALISYAEHDEHKTVFPAAQFGFGGDLKALSEIQSDTTWADTESGRGLVGTAIRSLKPCVMQLGMTSQSSAWSETASRCGYASGVAFPLLIHEKVVGALSIYSAEPDAFNGEELELLTETAQDLAFGIATLRARVKHDQTLEHMAYFDGLTGLPNRAYFEQHLRRSLLDAHRNSQSLALMIIDVNRLWEINDALGFHQGDKLLKEIGVRIRDLLSQEILVARMRGDEFAVLLPMSTADDAVKTSQQILNVLKETFSIADLKLEVSAVIGVSLYPQHGSESANLIRHADVAMHQAKKSGKGYAFYVAEDDEDHTERLALVGELRRAIDKDELILYYQPKIDMRDGGLCGLEALLRWNHPSRGMIPPDEFIPLAEQTGLINSLTEWVVRTALRQSGQWRKIGLTVPVAVNLSPRNLHDTELLARTQALFHEEGAHASWLEMEITEGAVMEDPEGALEVLKQLSAMGITLFIDDFGTGYSSLGYLKKLPVDAVKIDKSFVIDMLTDTDSAAIVRSTIGLAHDLDLKVVAEGIESQAIWDQLAALGCDVAQGYHISKPLPAEQIAGLPSALVAIRCALI